MRRGFLHKTVHDFKAELLMGFLTASKAQFDPHFHILAQKCDGMGQFRLEIVRINGRAELNLFHPPAGLLPAFLGLGFFVQELAVVDDAADRRNRIGGNFDQIVVFGPRERQCVAQCHDAQLLL